LNGLRQKTERTKPERDKQMPGRICKTAATVWEYYQQKNIIGENI